MSGCIAPVHGFQHGIRARLCGKMQGRHKRAQLAELSDYLVGQILWMAGCKTQTFDARLIERIEDLRKTRATVQVAAVGVHVLPQQRDFLHACCDITFCFSNDIIDGTRFFTAAYIGNDAICAEVVAADGDGQPCCPGMLACRGQFGWERRGSVKHLNLVAAFFDNAL